MRSSMKNYTVAIICLLTLLCAFCAGAQPPTQPPDLASADWSVKQAQRLNAEPKEVVFKSMVKVLGFSKLCWFKFVDLRHSGTLSLAVVYDNGGTADCNNFDVIDKTRPASRTLTFSIQEIPSSRASKTSTAMEITN
jgi:hypothetical protein